MSEPILEVRDLVKTFPIKSGIILERVVVPEVVAAPLLADHVAPVIGDLVGNKKARQDQMAAFDELVSVMEAGGGIGSDYELRELLSHTVQKARDPNAIARRYAQTAKRIGSDFERREALVALVRAGTLSREGALAVLDAAGGIGSDFERREVLVEVARRVPDDAVRARVLQLADDLSDFERRQVEDAVGAVRG